MVVWDHDSLGAGLVMVVVLGMASQKARTSPALGAVIALVGWCVGVFGGASYAGALFMFPVGVAVVVGITASLHARFSRTGTEVEVWQSEIERRRDRAQGTVNPAFIP